jgi:5-methylcytosine-specific restriction endonuclease McrA
VRFVISFNGEDETVIENGTWSEVPVGPTDLPPWAANFHTRNLKRLLAWVERYEAASRTYTLMVSGRQNSRRKRAESAGASTGNYTVAEMNKKVHRLGRACFYCGGPYQHDDHFLALSRFGIDTIENIVPACEACNESKGDSDPWEWMARRLQQGLLTNSRLCFALSSIEADASPKGLAALEQAFISAPPEILGPAKRPTRTYRLK